MILLINSVHYLLYIETVKIPVVKEHGSWAVFIFSCAAAVVTGFMTRPWQSGKDFSFGLLFTVLGLVFLINSKNPLTSVLRTKAQNKENIIWLVFFSLAGLISLLPFLLGGMTD